MRCPQARHRVSRPCLQDALAVTPLERGEAAPHRGAGQIGDRDLERGDGQLQETQLVVVGGRVKRFRRESSPAGRIGLTAWHEGGEDASHCRQQ